MKDTGTYERNGVTHGLSMLVMDEATLARLIKRGTYRLSEDGELEKLCRHCWCYWPADSEFYFSAKGRPDGLHSYCKACYFETRYPLGRSTRNERVMS